MTRSQHSTDCVPVAHSKLLPAWPIGTIVLLRWELYLWMWMAVSPINAWGIEDRLLGQVGGIHITQAELQLVLGHEESALDFAARQQAVQLFAQQIQALHTLRKLGLAPSGDEVDNWIIANLALDSRHESAGGLLQQFAKRAGVDELVYREYIEFRLAWKAYLVRHLTEKNLTRHFANQRPRFDGTEFKIALISAPASAGDSPQRRKLASELIELIGDDIDGALEKAVEETTAGDWRVTQSQWVRGTGALDPTLITPLLDLEIGRWHAPVHTASGVHAIALREVRPGEFKLDQVQSDVRAHMLLYLLEHLAQQSSSRLPLLSGN